jgi:transcriptional regulator with XRE-family HTH domain
VGENLGSWSEETATLFGDRLRELRELKGLSQQELADKAGLTRAGVAQFETGRRRPMWESVLALGKALGVSCQAFTTPAESRAKPGPGRPSKKPLPEKPKKKPKKD